MDMFSKGRAGQGRAGQGTAGQAAHLLDLKQVLGNSRQSHDLCGRCWGLSQAGMMLLNEGGVQLSGLEGGVYTQTLQESLIGGQPIDLHRSASLSSHRWLVCSTGLPSELSAASGQSEQQMRLVQLT